MPLLPPTARGLSARPSRGPSTQLSCAFGSPMPFQSTERARRPEKKATRPLPHGASVVSRLSLAEPNVVGRSVGPLPLGEKRPNEAGPEPDISEMKSPGP